eukprot:CAMPEP_0183775894 /NCGR_PEP_ID=MMETSP0739-20130205/45554_1 /TAXON_ID=385413 /ORGANISM="Thalassiosira miniscula, Strain CCMP1093" /LENGTH=57 /DNA_ID=CAMNT_0026017629 /DNA_START=44 /DNA_END=217 /DNA_ORIENTATION=-
MIEKDTGERVKWDAQDFIVGVQNMEPIVVLSIVGDNDNMGGKVSGGVVDGWFTNGLN